MPTQITALAVSKSLGGRLVLDSVTCSLAAGERTGIIGENGSGKTTLLRLLAGRERPDQGEVIIHADGGVTGNFRVLCDGQHDEHEDEVEETEVVEAVATQSISGPSPGMSCRPDVWFSRCRIVICRFRPWRHSGYSVHTG